MTAKVERLDLRGNSSPGFGDDGDEHTMDLPRIEARTPELA